jgi:hypothetical protein
MEIDMAKVGQAVSGTLPLVIACTIFLHQLVTKLIAGLDVLRRLTTEYRRPQEPPQGVRKESLKEQIEIYRKRCNHIRFGLSLVTVAELFFLVSIFLTVASLCWPLSSSLAEASGVTIVLGLVLLGWATCHELTENRMLARIIQSEVSDLE